MTTLYDLKVGDEVVMVSRHHKQETYRLVNVMATESTQLATQHPHLDMAPADDAAQWWWKKNGRPVDKIKVPRRDKGMSHKVTVMTQEAQDYLQRKTLNHTIIGTMYDLQYGRGTADLSTEALVAIASLCDKIDVICDKELGELPWDRDV